VLTTTPSDEVVLVFVSIINDTLPESVATDIARNVMQGNVQDVTVTAFQPSCMYVHTIIQYGTCSTVNNVRKFWHCLPGNKYHPPSQ